MNTHSTSNTQFNTATFMCWAMLTPLVAPLILMLLNLLIHQNPELEPVLRSDLYSFGGFLFIASVIAFIPYLVFTIVSWKKLKGMSSDSSIKYVLLSPVLFFLYQGVFLLIIAVVTTASNGMQALLQSLYSAIAVSAFVFPVGYGYVAFILVLYAIVRRFWLAKASGNCYLTS